MDFNPKFFEELLRSQAVQALVTAAAENVAAAARKTAPVDEGDYRDGIQVQLKFQQRAVALVVGTDPKTMLIESKTGNLARAVNSQKRSGFRG